MDWTGFPCEKALQRRIQHSSGNLIYLGCSLPRGIVIPGSKISNDPVILNFGHSGAVLQGSTESKMEDVLCDTKCLHSPIKKAGGPY